jgi:hypothetical protein
MLSLSRTSASLAIRSKQSDPTTRPKAVPDCTVRSAAYSGVRFLDQEVGTMIRYILLATIGLCVGCVDGAAICGTSADELGRSSSYASLITESDECAGSDGTYCESSLWSGACVGSQCVSCMVFVCKGVYGCSSSAMFANNGNIGNECPAGCFSACSL